MARIQLLYVINQRLLVHNPLGKLVVVSIDPRRLLLLCGEVKAADSYRAADRCRSLELMRSARPVMCCFLLLKVAQM